MLNTGLQLCWEMQQNAKMSSDPTTNIQYNSQRKTKQLANSTALFGNGFFPPKPHFSTFGASTTPLSSSLSWNLSLGSGRMSSSRHQILLAQAEQLPALTLSPEAQNVLICTESGLCTSETEMSWEKASFQTQQAFSHGICSVRGKGREQKGA